MAKIGFYRQYQEIVMIDPVGLTDDENISFIPRK